MSRHHNTKHPERGRSNYKVRLGSRGLTKAPTLEPADNLRTRQEARKKRTGVPWTSGISDSSVHHQEAA